MVAILTSIHQAAQALQSNEYHKHDIFFYEEMRSDPLKIINHAPNLLNWSGMRQHAINSFVYQCRLLITLANSLHPDQAQQIIGPDQGPNCLTF